MPPGSSPISDPADIVKGSQAAQFQVFSTSQSAEGVRAFYERMLPKRGWKIGLPPQLEQVKAQVSQRYDQLAKEHPDAQGYFTPESVQNILAPSAKKLNERLLYASRNDERLVLNFTASLDGRTTVVFVNSWRESSQNQGKTGIEQMAATLSGKPLSPAPESSCCGAEAVPGPLRKMPSLIPQYPNSRVLISGAAPSSSGGAGMISETYVTDDSPQQVTDFYERHMSYNGWEKYKMPNPLEDPQVLPYLNNIPAEQLRMVQDAIKGVTSLTFRKGSSLCMISVDGIRDQEPRSQQTNTPASKEGNLQSVSSRNRTMITVNYHPSLPSPESFHYVAPESLTKKR